MLYLCLGRGAGRGGLPLVRATARGTSATRSNGFGKKALLRGEKALLGVKTRSNAFQNPSNRDKTVTGGCRAAIRFVNKTPGAKRQRRLKTLKSGPVAAGGRTTARLFHHRREAEHTTVQAGRGKAACSGRFATHIYLYISETNRRFFHEKDISLRLVCACPAATAGQHRHNNVT